MSKLQTLSILALVAPLAILALIVWVKLAPMLP